MIGVVDRSNREKDFVKYDLLGSPHIFKGVKTPSINRNSNSHCDQKSFSKRSTTLFLRSVAVFVSDEEGSDFV